MSLKRNRGFTLFELMVTLGVFIVILGIATPQLSSFSEKRQVVSAAEAVYSLLQLARTEAVARSQTIYVKVDSNADSSVWGVGVSTNNDCDVFQADGDNTNDCFLITDDGDATLDTGDGATDPDDLVFNTFLSTDFTGVSMGDFDADETTDIQIAFEPVRGTATGDTVIVKLGTRYEMKVITFVTGRVRICSPAGSTHVGGYTSNSCS